MDKNTIEILNISGIKLDINNNEEILIERDSLLDLDDVKYNLIKNKISELKQIVSSSYLTCLHENAEKKQKFPLINLIRQLLQHYKYNLIPIRKCDGYTIDGIKKFKRFYIIRKQL